MIARLCVFCGSSAGSKPVYGAVARELGSELARRGIELVYGGGRVGLMGEVADGCLGAGGRVTGVIPQDLWDLEVGHSGLSELRVSPGMHHRKALMAEMSDGFIALPGGFGTYEELFEQLTWAQLGHHRKPVVVLDIEGFYEPLFNLLAAAEREGFMHSAHQHLLMRAHSIDEAIALVHLPTAAPVPKWSNG